MKNLAGLLLLLSAMSLAAQNYTPAGAAINLDIFNNHCDRVKMANIAQTINVLQSVILPKEKHQ